MSLEKKSSKIFDFVRSKIYVEKNIIFRKIKFRHFGEYFLLGDSLHPPLRERKLHFLEQAAHLYRARKRVCRARMNLKPS